MSPSGVRPSADEVESLIDRYTDNLMRAALALGFPPSEAEELVQDTFAAYLEGGARFEQRSRLLTYLFGILYNKARTARRLQDRHPSLEAIDEQFERRFDSEGHWDQASMDYVNEVEAKAQSAEIGRLLQECLDGLGALLRMAFTLREVEMRSSEEICASLSINPNHLGVLLFRARNKLRECLMSKGAVIA